MKHNIINMFCGFSIFDGAIVDPPNRIVINILLTKYDLCRAEQVAGCLYLLLSPDQINLLGELMFVFLPSWETLYIIIIEMLPCRGSFISNDLTFTISNVKMVRLHDQYYTYI